MWNRQCLDHILFFFFFAEVESSSHIRYNILGSRIENNKKTYVIEWWVKQHIKICKLLTIFVSISRTNQQVSFEFYTDFCLYTLFHNIVLCNRVHFRIIREFLYNTESYVLSHRNFHLIDLELGPGKRDFRSSPGDSKNHYDNILSLKYIPILHNLFKIVEIKIKIETEEILSNSSYETNITLILKPDTLQENYRPLFLINIDAKILNKCKQNE